MLFSTNIKFLRKRRSKTQDDVATALNMKRSTLSGYENEVSEPNIEALIALSKYFNVAIDTFSVKQSRSHFKHAVRGVRGQCKLIIGLFIASGIAACPALKVFTDQKDIMLSVLPQTVSRIVPRCTGTNNTGIDFYCFSDVHLQPPDMESAVYIDIVTSCVHQLI